MAVKALSEIKEESGRNLDALVDDNTLVAGERSSTFGVFKFFQGIKNFFKGITALGTLTSTSRIPVTDSNGNVSYTTPQQIKSEMNLVTASEIYKLIYNNTNGANYTNMNFGNGNFKFIAYSGDGGYCTGEFTQLDDTFIGSTQINNGNLTVLGQGKDTIYFSKSLTNLKVWKL